METKQKLLLVDDDVDFLNRQIGLFSSEFGCVSVSDPAAVRPACEEEDPDAVLLDLLFDGEPRGFDVLLDLVASFPFLPVIIWSDETKIEASLEALQKGAFFYVTKLATTNDVRTVVDAALEHRRVLIENTDLRDQVERSWGGVVCESKAMQQVMALVDKVARRDCSVLITGETGVGKEVIAHEIHARSARSRHPWRVVNCGLYRDRSDFLRDDLFGHEPGGFTDAKTRKLGLCERASGGTLFLDEIGDVPSELQPVLLRFAEHGEFTRVGGTKEKTVDVRIISATNVNIDQAVEEGRFRLDLLERLDTIRIHIPPLRDRRDDIVPLATEFLRRVSQKHQRGYALAEASLHYLRAQLWKGNARDVLNAVERACILADSPVLMPTDLANAPGRTTAPILDYRKATAEFKRDFVVNLFQATHGSVAEAGGISGLSKGHLHRMLSAFGLSADDFK